MKTILAAFMVLGMVISTGIMTISAHAANTTNWNETTVSGNAAG